MKKNKTIHAPMIPCALKQLKHMKFSFGMSHVLEQISAISLLKCHHHNIHN